MRDVGAEMANKSGRTESASRKPADQSVALDSRYRKIGISAVAAAARYQGTTKNPAYAPAVLKFIDHHADKAALA